MSAVRARFLLPAACFAIVAAVIEYGGVATAAVK